ncbi:Eukaryotic translation initiation factor 2C [Tulasnella sp. 408]|nr:Eukaryotic translation initiation factor 2C [Tulasnella sp. 408]
MQEQYPTIFTKRGSYDGRKNLYSPVEYSLDREQFEVNDGRPWPRLIRIKYAATINPSSATRYIEGKMSQDNHVITTLNACNVAIRMQPMQCAPSSHDVLE